MPTYTLSVSFSNRAHSFRNCCKYACVVVSFILHMIDIKQENIGKQRERH